MAALNRLAAARAWTASPKRYLRIDPHEFPTARTFHIDDVKLTAKPVAAGQLQRSVRRDGRGWRMRPRLSLYYDADTNPSNGKTLIASGIPASAGQFSWNYRGVPRGEYYMFTRKHPMASR